MSTKTYCDICGRELGDNDSCTNFATPSNKNGVYLSFTTHTVAGHLADVCKECGDRILKLLKEVLEHPVDPTIQEAVVIDVPEEHVEEVIEAVPKSAVVEAADDPVVEDPEDPPKEYTLKEVIDATKCDKVSAYNYIYHRKEALHVVTTGKRRCAKTTLTLTKAQFDKIIREVREIAAQRVLALAEGRTPRGVRKPPKAPGGWELEGGAPLKTKEAWLKERVGTHIVFLHNGAQTSGQLMSAGSFTFDVVLENGIQLTVITENTPLKPLNP